MKNLFIIIVIILTGLSACKDDCLTCPENEAVINGECQCIEIYFNGECKNRESSFEPKYIRGTSVSFQPLFSEAKECNSVFDFNNQPLFIYLSEITEYDNRVSAVIAVQTESW